MPGKDRKNVAPKRRPRYKAMAWATVPPEVMNAAASGSITWIEHGLVCIINSLCSDSETGCFASNQYLGDAVGYSESYVSHMLSRLVKAGILVIETRVTASGNQRHIWPLWVKCNRKIKGASKVKTTSNPPDGGGKTGVVPPPKINDDVEGGGYDGCLRGGYDGCLTPTYKVLEDTKSSPAAADAADGGVIAVVNCREAQQGKHPCVVSTADKPEATAIPDKSTKSRRTITGTVATADNPDRDNARLLFDILTRHGKLKGKRRVDVDSWAKDFSRLSRDGVLQDEIADTLNWYDKNLHLKFCPKCYAANTFCEEYTRIRDAMQRHQDESPSLEPVPIKPEELTAEEKDVLRWARESFDWRATTIGLLPNLIAATYRSYDEFNLRCHKLMRTLDQNDRLYHMARRVVANWGKPGDYVRDWLEHTHGKYAGWKEWSGHFKPCVVGSEQFNQEGVEVSLDFIGHEGAWGELLKALGYQS